MKGWKTWAAIGLYVVCEVVKIKLPEYTPIAIHVESLVCAPLGIVGIAHKVEKIGK